MTPAARRLLLIVLSFVAFVSLGLPDAVLGVAWPFMRQTFDLPISRLGAFLACGVAGYLASSLAAGTLVRRLGVGRVLLFSTLLVAAALVGYAMTPRWELLLPAAVCVGLGSGTIDSGINAFAASTFSARVVTWLHAFYGVGATLGPAVMTVAVTSGSAAATAAGGFAGAGGAAPGAGGGWRWGYAAIAGLLAAVSVAFALTLPLWRLPAEGGGGGDANEPGVATDNDAGAGAAVLDYVVDDRPATAGEALRNPVVLAQVLLFLIYTGTEVTAGQWLFSLLTESRGFAAEPAGAAVATFWGALTVGRIVFGQLAASLAPLPIIRFGTLLAPAAALLICWRAGGPAAAFAGAGLLGFALAPIFPMLIAVTPTRVGGRLTAQAVGFQVSAATVGVAALPSLAGVLARPLGLEVVGPFLLVATIALLVQHEVVVRVAGRGTRTRAEV